MSSGYEFVELSFRLWLTTPTSVPALFLANYIHPYLYLVSNASYVANDHQGSYCTIKINVNNKTLKHPYCELYISIKVIVKDFLIGNFLHYKHHVDVLFATMYCKYCSLLCSHLVVQSLHNILGRIYGSTKVLSAFFLRKIKKADGKRGTRSPFV